MIKLTIIPLLLSLILTTASAQDITLQDVFPGVTIDNMLGLEAPDMDTDYIYVLSQFGMVYQLDTANPENGAELWLDISDRISELEQWSELGLLGLAFHPDYEENGRIYISYATGRDADPYRSFISRFYVDEGEVDMNSEEPILDYHQPAHNHNAGQIRFGPDEYLYISSGDGGGQADQFENGQDTSNLLGTMIRIDVDNTDDGLNYAIPEDNPFVDDDDVLDEIYAYGFRNPWRFSFDFETGTMWVADVGEDEWEIIHHVEGGKNYGWSIIEGSHCFPPGSSCDDEGLEMPMYEYNPGDQRGSITGGYVYHGQNNPGLEGLYIYGDYMMGKIWALDYDEENEEVLDNTELLDTNYRFSSFGEDSNGEIYALDYESGEIFRIEQEPVATDPHGYHGPEEFTLEQNYPNPFNPKTDITFALPEASQINLSVYNSQGQKIETLTDGVLNEGIHRVTFDGTGLASGVYLYRLEANNFTQTRQMLFLK